MDKITEFLIMFGADSNENGAYIYTHESGDSINLLYLLKDYEDYLKEK